MNRERHKGGKRLDLFEPRLDARVLIKSDIAFGRAGDLTVQRNVGDRRSIGGKPAGLLEFGLDHG